jgi:RNA polymerase sigma-70 factor, ECF subfamily
MPSSADDVTALLAGISAGNNASWNRLLAVVYRELHSLAHSAMRREKPGNTLQTTALVNEAYMRLVRSGDRGWENRAYFFSVAARAMRRILVDRARSKKAVKRGSGQRPASLDVIPGHEPHSEATPGIFEDLEALDKALSKLGALPAHKRKCTMVELRFFVGLTVDQTAEVLDVSPATIARDWEFTRAWLCCEIEKADSHDR